MEYRDLLPKAIAMATEAHGNTLSKDGTPYILHPLRLMIYANGYAEQILAVLHDTVEDTHLTLDDLAAAGFPPEIIAGVDAVTNREGEDYDAFIERIALNPLAVRVKLLDLHDNMDLMRLAEITDRDLARVARYHRAVLRLRQTLPSEAATGA